MTGHSSGTGHFAGHFRSVTLQNQPFLQSWYKKGLKSVRLLMAQRVQYPYGMKTTTNTEGTTTMTNTNTAALAIIANASRIDEACFANPRYYVLTESDSDRWGANAGEGCEADDNGTYRRALKAELQTYANALGQSVEIVVCDHDGNDWTADVLEAIDVEDDEADPAITAEDAATHARWEARQNAAAKEQGYRCLDHALEATDFPAAKCHR